MSALERMIEAVPPFVADDPVMLAVYTAIAPELDILIDRAATTPQQAWPQLVSWALPRLESIYGVVPAAGAREEYRRGVLLAKMRSAPVSTLDRIKNVAASYGGEGIYVAEDTAGYAVHVKILNDIGTPAYLDAMKRSLRAIVPAHLALTIALRWILWNELLARAETWNQVAASGVTWANLKEHGGV